MHDKGTKPATNEATKQMGQMDWGKWVKCTAMSNIAARTCI
jgi:hypothetical protein